MTFPSSLLAIGSLSLIGKKIPTFLNSSIGLQISLVLLLIVIAAGCQPSPRLGDFDFVHSCGSPNGDIPTGCEAYAPDGTKLARMGQRKHPEVLNLPEGAPRSITEVEKAEPENDAKAFSFSPDSQKLAIVYHHAGQLQKVYVVDIDTLRVSRMFSFSGDDYYHEMGYHSNWKSIAFILRHRNIGAILDTETGKVTYKGGFE